MNYYYHDDVDLKKQKILRIYLIKLTYENVVIDYKNKIDKFKEKYIEMTSTYSFVLLKLHFLLELIDNQKPK